MKDIEEDHLRATFFDAFASRPRPLVNEILRSPVDPSEGAQVRQLLAATEVTNLSNHDIGTVVESNLWMLGKEAFLHFLPAFMYASLSANKLVGVFADELIGALTLPSRNDVVEAIDLFAKPPIGSAMPDNLIEHLREQQLEWFDSGVPAAIFEERFDGLSRVEGSAVLAFLKAFKIAHGADFPFDELDVAINGFWSRYRDSGASD